MGEHVHGCVLQVLASGQCFQTIRKMKVLLREARKAWDLEKNKRDSCAIVAYNLKNITNKIHISTQEYYGSQTLTGPPKSPSGPTIIFNGQHLEMNHSHDKKESKVETPYSCMPCKDAITSEQVGRIYMHLSHKYGLRSTYFKLYLGNCSSPKCLFSYIVLQGSTWRKQEQTECSLTTERNWDNCKSPFSCSLLSKTHTSPTRPTPKAPPPKDQRLIPQMANWQYSLPILVAVLQIRSH